MSVLRTLALALVLAALLIGAPSVAAPYTAAHPSSPADAAASASTRPAGAVQAADMRASDQRIARAYLKKLARTWRYLGDVTVTVATTPQGEQAVAYYRQGEIVINSAHTVGIEKILDHEVWHVIDWRDNGRLDWGEDLPPSNSSSYSR